MPTYTYQCGHCDHEFELRQGFDAKPEYACPLCHSKAQRRFHPVGIIYKGSGFYSTDYRKSDSRQPSNTTSETDKSSSKPSVADTGESE